jgi:predicted extracellular nuclease
MRSPIRALATLLLLIVFTAAPALGQQPTDLFFSEYVEGSSNNKAIEVFNGTGSPVALADYVVELYSNGSDTPGNTLTLSDAQADLANGDVLVIANPSADQAILDESDITSGVTFYNGDDALVLRKNGAVVDVIGQVGVDPGSEWGSGDTSTGENTIRRMEDVCSGDTNPDDAFDPADEWNGFPQDTFDGLGSHTVTCGGRGPPPRYC